MKTIELPDEQVCIVSDEDYPMLCKYKWRAAISAGNEKYTYVWTCEKHRKAMHRMILNPRADMDVDHINGNGLDNRRENLRICTRSQHHANRRKLPNCTSRYKGVYHDKKRNRWIAQLFKNSIRVFWATCNSEIEAAEEYDKAAKKYFGEYTRLNSPKEKKE